MQNLILQRTKLEENIGLYKIDIQIRNILRGVEGEV